MALERVDVTEDVTVDVTVGDATVGLAVCGGGGGVHACATRDRPQCAPLCV